MKPIIRGLLPAALCSEVMAFRAQDQRFARLYLEAALFLADVQAALPDNKQIEDLDMLAVRMPVSRLAVIESACNIMRQGRNAE
jgi:hypothetical protein